MATDKKSLGQRLQDFMLSHRGKVIMNYAYSWGAAIVIAGTLFKLTHLPGANLMLWLGMGTEVLVFFLSAFDLPQATGNTPQIIEGGNLSGDSVAPFPHENIVPPVTSEMHEATQAYVDRLREMTEMLSHFKAQADMLVQDADQIHHLKQNLAGINAIYEMQLRSASAQMGTIDQVHEETRKMARQIEELNHVYARMLQAMQAKGN